MRVCCDLGLVLIALGFCCFTGTCRLLVGIGVFWLVGCVVGFVVFQGLCLLAAALVCWYGSFVYALHGGF